MQYTKRGYLLLFMMFIILLVSAGCSSSDNNNSASSTKSEDSSASEVRGESGSTEAAKAETALPSGGGNSDGGIGDIAPSDSSGADSGFNQKLIYKAELTMEVGNYDTAVTELRNAIHQSGGYILQFQDGQYKNEKGSTYTIKVPSVGFMAFIERLEGIEHKRFERQVGATDVTEEYVDLESRLKAKQIVEERLLGFMDKAQKADDLVKFSQQLSEVQEEIEVLKGRIRYLDRNVAFSTVELRMYQPSNATAALDENKALGSKMSTAMNGSVDTLLVVLQGLLIFLSGALPVLLCLAIIGLPIYWLMRRHKRRPITPIIKPQSDALGQEKAENNENQQDPLL
ncbi:MAG: DUF4349 domain-containing protein [Candidatus Pristimantibacillus sp.]